MRRICTILLLFIMSLAVGANAQTVSLTEQQGKAESGKLLLEVGETATVSVKAYNAEGKELNAAMFAPHWDTKQGSVALVQGSGGTATVTARANGQTILSVKVLNQTAELEVVVGNARSYLKAEDLTERFRAAKLELIGSDPNKVSGSVILLEQNDEVALTVKATRPDGSELPLKDFPPVWSVKQQSVARVEPQGLGQARLTSRANGSTTVTVQVQGLTASMKVYAGTYRSEVKPEELSDDLRVARLELSGSQAGTPGASGSVPVGQGSQPSPIGQPGQVITNGAGAGGTLTQAEHKPLAAPSNVKVASIGQGRLAVSWDAVEGAVGYAVLAEHQGNWAGATMYTNANDWMIKGTFAPTFELPTGATQIAVVAYRDAQGAVQSPRSAPVAVTVPRWKGRYRVTLTGFKANRETLDDPLETDGKRDEVFAQAQAQEYDADGNPVGARVSAKTRIHGDVNYSEWQKPGPHLRSRAGSASSLGGIKSGDAFPTSTPWVRNGAEVQESFPLFVWEGELKQGGNSVMIVPTLWESDRRPKDALVDNHFAAEKELIDAAGKYLARRQKLSKEDLTLIQTAIAGLSGDTNALEKAADMGLIPRLPLASTPVPQNASSKSTLIPMHIQERMDALSEFALRTSQNVKAELTGLVNNLNTAALNYASVLQQRLQMQLNTADRPIGIEAPTATSLKFDPKTIALTFENVEPFLSGQTSSLGLPSGVMEVRYTDGVPGLGGNGDYSLYLEIRRVD